MLDVGSVYGASRDGDDDDVVISFVILVVLDLALVVVFVFLVQVESVILTKWYVLVLINLLNFL